jgi:transcriptional regulator with XRE-family HTH domain
MQDDIALGRMVQEVRLFRNLRQKDVAERAGVGNDTVSRLERGLVDGMTVRALRAISRALEMPSIVGLGWRAPELERFRDRLHAAMVEQTVALLIAGGWEVAPEHSFNHFGERGAVDVLAWHPHWRALLVVEVKTRLWDLQETLSTLDRKRRLLPLLAARDRGWSPDIVGVALTLPELSTHRHAIARHRATFRAAFPDGQIDVRRWLERPDRDLRAVWFLPNSDHGRIGRRAGRRRATRRRRNATKSRFGPLAMPDSTF